MQWSSQDALKLAKLMLTSSTDAPEALDPRVASWPGNGCNRTDQSAIIKWTPCFTVTDYFSKWAEAAALSEVVSAVLNFLRTKILSIFGVPKGFIHDKGPQFRDQPFSKFCEKVIFKYLMAYKAATNGLIEA